ncbi:MAG TPA: class I SAM-dependent methyltransferase [Polyangiaceae bacterium]|nr:class I SAM-dependent methyltransferase [Polyangiaceae bacterium]
MFNRVADVYPARPPYPEALVQAIAALAPRGGRVLDVGAGIGHLALPLAEAELDVLAIEPAEAMLDALRQRMAETESRAAAIHGAAESLPVPDDSADLVVIADGLHFMDVELTEREVRRVLRRGGALAVVTAELADTSFMNRLRAVMEESAPRRPRDVRGAVTQLLALLRPKTVLARDFAEETQVDPERLERILGSISYIGPAMNAELGAAFRAKVREIPGPRLWARRLTLHSGHR